MSIVQDQVVERLMELVTIEEEVQETEEIKETEPTETAEASTES